MIWMKATTVPFRIARSALAELLLAQGPAYIVFASMSTARYGRLPCDLIRGEEPSDEQRWASSLLLRVPSGAAWTTTMLLFSLWTPSPVPDRIGSASPSAPTALDRHNAGHEQSPGEWILGDTGHPPEKAVFAQPGYIIFRHGFATCVRAMDCGGARKCPTTLRSDR